jgi:hypothetical protein
MSHIVQNYLTLTTDTTPNDAAGVLPAGWLQLANVIEKAAKLCGVNDITVVVKNGILYVTCQNAGQPDMFSRLMRTLLQDSAKTCMVCGSFGLRRKEQVGCPPLCANHYVEYINAIEE